MLFMTNKHENMSGEQICNVNRSFTPLLMTPHPPLWSIDNFWLFPVGLTIALNHQFQEQYTLA